ncbi:hypothetical protein DLY76_06570 [Staphylococcus warneri]|uniref:hypothetical protein n=1 Tax=Staphylococcus warneri TaxID=1292 RepID=UPI000D87442B|nr:hypothetical protein [Staphylococcus warneri]PXX85683.1 hypothetical protein DLY76_06570 [Staphylococcus warneri]
MTKIKTKRRMDKKELAQFLIDNTEVIGITKSYKDGKYFEETIRLEPISNKMKKISKNIIEVEVEEEITEDTKIENLIELHKDNFISIYQNEIIDNVKDFNSKAFYIMNEDMTMTLIWKDGVLV